MKISKTILALLLAGTFAGSAWSQSAAPNAAGEVLGYLNPHTNSFRPVYLQQMAATGPGATSVATGKIVTNFTISVKSPLSTTATLFCSVSASIADTDPKTFVISNFISELGNISEARTGATTKCTVTMAYSWMLANRSTDKVQLFYSITASPSSNAPGNLFRSSSQTLGTIPIPANGATTTETVNATI